MPRPKFRVQHFIACLAAPWDGTPGPEMTRTLELTGYTYRLPPDTEFPAKEEFWLYARLFWTGGGDGFRRFRHETYWNDAPGGPVRVDRQPLPPVRLTGRRPVVMTAWQTGKLPLPGVGQYEFRLLCAFRNWSGRAERVVATEYIRIVR